MQSLKIGHATYNMSKLRDLLSDYLPQTDTYATDKVNISHICFHENAINSFNSEIDGDAN